MYVTGCKECRIYGRIAGLCCPPLLLITGILTVYIKNGMNKLERYFGMFGYDIYNRNGEARGACRLYTLETRFTDMKIEYGLNRK